MKANRPYSLPFARCVGLRLFLGWVVLGLSLDTAAGGGDVSAAAVITKAIFVGPTLDDTASSAEKMYGWISTELTASVRSSQEKLAVDIGGDGSQPIGRIDLDVASSCLGNLAPIVVPFRDPDSPRFTYGGFIVRAELPREAFLVIGSPDLLEIRINDVAQSVEPRWEGNSNYCYRVELKAGRNLMLLKLSDRIRTYRFEARVFDSAKDAAQSLIADRHGLWGDIIPKRIVAPENGQLPVRLPRVFLAAQAKLQVLKPTGGNVCSETTTDRSIETAAFESGSLYRLRLEVGKQACEDVFLWGEKRSYLHSIEARFSGVDSTELPTANVIGRRMGVLSEAIEGTRNQVERSRMEREFLERCLDAELLGLKPENLVRHLLPDRVQLRGYSSATDRVDRAYYVFAARQRELVSESGAAFIFPNILEGTAHYLDGFAFNAWDANQVARLAGSKGMTVVWLGYRSRSAIAAEAATFFEVFENVRTFEAWDLRRTIAIGARTSASVALATVAQRPKIFSALALLNPNFDVISEQEPEYLVGFDDYPEFQAALSIRPHVDRLLGEGAPEIYVVQDGSPVARSDQIDDLQYLAVKAGYPSTFARLNEHTVSSIGAWDRLFSWCSSQPPNPDASLQAEKLVRDPIASSALSEDLLIVVGTQGSDAETRKNREIAARMNSEIARSFSTTREIADDIDFIRNPRRGITIVLIGTASNNAAWRDQGEVDTRQDGSGLAIGAHHWEGHGLSYVRVLPRGHNSGGFLVLVGGDHPTTFEIPLFGVGNEGWFSYAVWRSSGTATRLVEAGRL